VSFNIVYQSVTKNHMRFLGQQKNAFEQFEIVGQETLGKRG